MKKLDFSRTQVVLYGADAGRRHLAHDVLDSVDLPVIHEPVAFDDLCARLADDEPDLVILVLDGQGERLCDLVRDVRHDKIGANPYVVILALTWESEHRLISLAINAGMDDIIAMPVSISVLTERFETLINKRREFVATPTYVGPDRRKPSRPTTDELGTFPVPNGLRYKTLGDGDAAPDALTLRAARKTTVRHRLHRITTRVSELATLLEDAHKGTGSIHDAAIAKREIDELLDRMNEELDPRDHRHLVGLAASMRAVMRTLGGRDDPGTKKFELFRLHGQAMTASLTFSDDAAELIARTLNEATGYVGEGARRAAGLSDSRSPGIA